MLRNALRGSLAFFVAPLVPLSIAAFLSFEAALPDGAFAWPWAIYVTTLSALLVGLPTVSVLRRLHLTSLRAFVLTGFLVSAGSAAIGAIGLYLIDLQGPAYNPMESGISSYGPNILISIIAAYSVCGAIAAAAYWAVARPDTDVRPGE
jgi:hypothetical protein